MVLQLSSIFKRGIYIFAAFLEDLDVILTIFWQIMLEPPYDTFACSAMSSCGKWAIGELEM